ncbi:MAG TPA: hypothetical protein VG275_07010 [Solirubrobacteraceae bacterium]|jgi:hypothetical protein|nr:hypothetical protein [Solirubrobacteraceae bacterium]
MEPIVIGRVENPSEQDLTPQEITLVGYTLEREEVSETFRFRPVVPAGAQLEIIRHTDQAGNVALPPVIAFVEECLLEDELDAFRAFLHRPDVMIEQGTIIGLYRALTEYYAARPTRRPSASASTGQPAKRTSRAAARSAASRSKTSRSS